MKKFTLFAAGICMAMIVNAQTPAASKTTPAPAVAATPQQHTEVKDISKNLQFTNAEYDFGKIPFGKPAEYQLEIKNIGKDTATLDRVQVGCGCTTPKYEAGKKFAPGESVKVTLGFNGSTDGAFTKFVTVFFNDGMSKQVTFKGETYKTPDSAAPANAGVQKMKAGQ